MSDLNETLIFSKDFQKNSSANFTKIRSEGAELFHVDRWTDMTRLILAFRNSAVAPTNFTAFTWYLMLLRLHVCVSTPKYAAHNTKIPFLITANTVPLLTVRKVLSLSHTQGCKSTRLIVVIKYIITGAFQTASFLPANYWRTVIRPLLQKVAVHRLLITFNI